MGGRIARRLTLAGLAVGITANAQPQRYLVELKNSRTFDVVAKNVRAAAAAAGSTGPVRLMNTDATIARALTNIKVLVISSDDEAAIRSLADHPAILRVEAEVMHRAPKPVATFSRNAVSRQITPDLVTRPWGIDAVRAPAAWSVTRGEGARVLVLDTGVDQEHPALRSRFEKGLNFTTADAADFEDREGHGTHVAGTILGDGRRGGVVGVAPEARLLAGKVCAQNGCSSVSIAAGLDWAIEEGVDVVNMSLSGDTLTGIEAAALKRAEAAGVVIAAASGNDGVGYVGYPAAVPSVIAVGAIGPDVKIASFSQWGPELAVVGPGVDVVSSVPRGTGRESEVNVGGVRLESKAALGTPAVAIAGDLITVGLGQEADYRGVDVRGRVALITRGRSKFVDKMKAAVAHGARAIVFVNNEAGLMKASLGEGGEIAVPAAMIERAAGEAIKARLAAGERIAAELNVRATDYADLQGTSMATPHVAGVIALVRAANRSLSAAEVREIIRGTAAPLGPNGQNQYGRGLVNAGAAVERALSPVAGAEDLRRASN